MSKQIKQKKNIIKPVKAWAIVFKIQKTGAITNPMINWQYQIFHNKLYAQKRLGEFYKDISKYLKIIPVLITPIVSKSKKIK